MTIVQDTGLVTSHSETLQVAPRRLVRARSGVCVKIAKAVFFDVVCG